MVGLDRDSTVPLHRQLYEGLRGEILSGRLPAGSRLPSVRSLIREFGISRNTVTGALSQLSAEGYLEARVGSGTYVARSMPDELLRAGKLSKRLDRQMPMPGPSRRRPEKNPQERLLSRRGSLLATTSVGATVRSTEPSVPFAAFAPAVPDVGIFPHRTWGRIAGKLWRRPPENLLRYGAPAGYRPLREAIAEHLRASRAVDCSWERVIVVSGSQQALDLCARLLLDPGDEVWIEDPCYLGTRAALSANGARTIPVPVDGEGLDVSAGEEKASDARLACVTPSHQYPSGVTMSVGRRLALLEWSSRVGAWVLEDDYDGEFRYSGRPLPSLQGLAEKGRILYLGTFSKSLFPALRLGYLVVPENLVDAFVNAKALSHRHTPAVEQAILAEFIAEGHFGRHLRRARKLYVERQAALVEAADKELAGLLEVRASDAGLHLVGRLGEEADDELVSQRAARMGVRAPSLSAHRLSESGHPGLVLGYAAFKEQIIRHGVRRLAEALRQTNS
jgi:GntR family transcriptional regulator/MocR family aminotransferase